MAIVVLQRAFTIMLVAAAVLHCGMIALYLLPGNAITLVNLDVIHAYTRPFFTQKWQLFAPSPPLVNERFLIQLMVQPRVGGKQQTTEWIDITTPLQRRCWSNPLSPEVMRLRTIRGAFIAYTRLLNRRSSSKDYTLTEYDIHASRVFGRLLGQVAQEVVDRSPFDVLAVRGRVIMESIPPFSELDTHQKPEQVQSVTFEWFPIHSSTALFGDVPNVEIRHA